MPLACRTRMRHATASPRMYRLCNTQKGPICPSRLCLTMSPSKNSLPGGVVRTCAEADAAKPTHAADRTIADTVRRFIDVSFVDARRLPSNMQATEYSDCG